jgi:hypothetical protein
MTETFVVHLQSGALAGGDVRGVVEVVATGERRTVTTIEELRTVLVQQAVPDRKHDDTVTTAAPVHARDSPAQ